MAIHIFCYLTLKQYFSILNVQIGKKYCLSCLFSLSHLSLPSPSPLFLTSPFCFLPPPPTHTHCCLFLSLSFWTPLISWSPFQPYWASFPLSLLPSPIIFSVPLLHYPKKFSSCLFLYLLISFCRIKDEVVVACKLLNGHLYKGKEIGREQMVNITVSTGSFLWNLDILSVSELLISSDTYLSCLVKFFQQA